LRFGHLFIPYSITLLPIPYSKTLLSHCYHTVITLSSHCSHTVITLLSHCYHTVITLLSHCHHTFITLSSHCSHTVITLLSNCYHTVITLLSHCYHKLLQSCSKEASAATDRSHRKQPFPSYRRFTRKTDGLQCPSRLVIFTRPKLCPALSLPYVLASIH
jgi:hypothetical protein